MTNNLTGPVSVSAKHPAGCGNGDGFGTLGSGPVTNNATLSLNRGDTVLNVANSIHGTGTLSIDGFGAVTISGNSDFSGSTLLNVGIVFLTSATGLGSTSAGTVVSSGAQLYITANVDVAEGLTIAGAGDGNGALRKGGAGQTVENGSGRDGGGFHHWRGHRGDTCAFQHDLRAVRIDGHESAGTLTLTKNSTMGSFTLSGPVVNVVTRSAHWGSSPVTVNGAGRLVLVDGLNFANTINCQRGFARRGQRVCSW